MSRETAHYFFNRRRIVMDFYNDKINCEYDLNEKALRFFMNLIEDYDKKDVIDKAHDKRHLYQVTNAMLYLGDKLKLDLNLCLAIGALHDIGLLSGDREMHHKKSAEWVRNNSKALSNLGYSSDEINIIETAVAEHRSSGTVKSSIYSKAITDADKIPTHNVDAIIKRSLLYTKERNAGLSDEDMFEKMYAHVHDKYGKGVYGNKFYTEPAIKMMESKNNEIIKCMNNKELCFEKVQNILINKELEEI